ncbi:MAG: hypothetical protein J0J10_23350 [Bosea sp.]|uniref:hypothetical protein n=1 Tax=Bosea sp. (in: a-proteobacteria) TaxID=1871050 RepID=UPI001AD465AA|nr:hypothetical protein [Bosea sp. (in: a-proteobacteria)]MBN9471710.1 hypothetical protein [Bosea sp. (in: a-proteobacteria)]
MSKAKRETAAHLTYFVVQAYKAVKGMRGGISAEDPREARDHNHAMALFERLKPGRAGIVAFRRTGSPATGEFEDAVIIARHGRLPAEVDGLVDETELEADSWDLGEGDLKVA